jgi:hypothetical protein
MAKTQMNISTLAKLRGRIQQQNPLPENICPLAGPRPEGFVDLSRPESTVTAEIIDAVAPLGALFAEREKVTAEHIRIIKKFPERIPDDRRFLPADFQQHAAAQVVINDYLLIDRIADQGKIFYQRPLELLATESYRSTPTATRRNSPAGVAHWVYDPLTNKWFLVQRWGCSESSDPISLYRRWESASKRRSALEYELKRQRRLAANPEYPRISARQLAEKFRQRLLFSSTTSRSKDG